VDRERLVRYLGKLPDKAMTSVLATLAEFFAA
jgi:hypothetical protein